MTGIKITSKLPGGDANGLSTVIQSLIDRPDHFHAIIAIIDCKETKTDCDTGDVTPVARIRRVEVILPADLFTAQRLMTRSFEARTGKTVLPLNLEDDIILAFGRVDPERPNDDDT